MRNYSKIYKVSILVFLMLISLNSTAFAQRVLLGLSIEGVDFYTYSGSKISQCEYENDCYETRPQSVNRPAISFEFNPYYLIGNFGFNIWIDSPREYELRLIGYPFNDKNSYLDIRLILMRINSSFFLTFGDKELGKNNNNSFRIGYLMGIVDRQTMYTYKGNTKTLKEPNVGSTGYFIAFDLSNHLSFSAYHFYNEAEQIELGIDPENKPNEFHNNNDIIRYKEYRYLISYSYYFD